MTLTPKVSVIIPVTYRGAHLDRLLQSFAQHASADSCELIVVLRDPENLLKAQLELSSFPLRLAEVSSSTWLTPSFLRDYARAPIVLFLSEHCYLDDSETIENHLSLHQFHPTALGIGGRFRRSDQITIVEEAFDLISNDELDATRMDGLKSAHLFVGHMSFKTDPLLVHLAEIKAVDPRLLPSHLARMGEVVLLVDNLTVRHRLDLSLSQFAQEAFYSGQIKRRKLEADLLSDRRYYRLFLPLDEQLQTYPVYKRAMIRWLWQIYDLAFQSGYIHSESIVPVSLLGMLVARWARYIRFTAASVWFGPFFTELYCGLRFVLKGRLRDLVPFVRARTGPRRSRYDTIDLR